MAELYYLPLEVLPSAVRLNGFLAFLVGEPFISVSDTRQSELLGKLKGVQRPSRASEADLAVAEWRPFDLDAEALSILQRWMSENSLSDSGWNLQLYPDSDTTDAPVPITLSLNVTEQCNIACTYCYFTGGYGGNRGHNASSLSPDVTEKALRHFFKASGVEAPSCLYFFGGEPLLAMRQIQATLEAAANLGVDAVKAVATNGMLLDEAAVGLFKNHEVYLAVSIDGPNHDKARVRRNGSGTLRCVEERLEWLRRFDPEFLSCRVSTSCVVDAGADLEALYDYFRSNAALREVLHWDFDIVLSGLESLSGFEYPERSLRLLVDWYLAFVTLNEPVECDETFWRYFFASGFNIVHRAFWTVAARRVANPKSSAVRGPLGTLKPPGSSMITVRPNGDLIAGNERQKAAYVIGSAEHGIDPQRVRRLAAGFERMIDALQCRHCWAASQCTLTLSDFDVDDGAELDGSRSLTQYHQRCVLERRLIAAFTDRLATLSPTERVCFDGFLRNELEAMA